MKTLAPVFDGGTLADACDMEFDSFLIAQEKIDGVRAWLDCDTGKLTGRNSYRGILAASFPSGCALDGEIVKDTFHAFDLLKLNGQDVTGEPLGWRLAQLDSLAGDFLKVKWSRDCQRLAREVNERGGEGIVTKRESSPYLRGFWKRYKRELTIDCQVANVDPWKKSAEVLIEGESAGMIFGFSDSEIDTAKPGAWIEVKAMELTQNGKLRHGRFLRFRKDKEVYA